MRKCQPFQGGNAGRLKGDPHNKMASNIRRSNGKLEWQNWKKARRWKNLYIFVFFLHICI